MFSRAQFGERLRKAREQKGETQTAVARAMGVTSTLLSDLEKGRRTTTIERFCFLCDYYHVSADYLLGLTDDPRPLEDRDTAAPG